MKILIKIKFTLTSYCSLTIWDVIDFFQNIFIYASDRLSWIPTITSKKQTVILLISFLIASCQTRGISPENAKKSNLHVEVANNLIQRNLNPEAIAELHKALNLNPMNAVAHHALALCLHQRGRTKESIHHFKQSLKIDPKNTNVRNNFITLLLEKKFYKSAFYHSKYSINDLTYPNPAQSYYLRFQAALNWTPQNLPIKHIAKKSLLQTLKYQPKHCGALFSLGKLYTKQNESKKSYVLFHKSLKNCQIKEDKLRALNKLIPLAKKLRLVYQWGKYKQLRNKLKHKKIRN